jgi:hypothetical protein
VYFRKVSVLVVWRIGWDWGIRMAELKANRLMKMLFKKSRWEMYWNVERYKGDGI